MIFLQLIIKVSKIIKNKLIKQFKNKNHNKVDSKYNMNNRVNNYKIYLDRYQTHKWKYKKKKINIKIFMIILRIFKHKIMILLIHYNKVKQIQFQIPILKIFIIMIIYTLLHQILIRVPFHNKIIQIYKK